MHLDRRLVGLPDALGASLAAGKPRSLTSSSKEDPKHLSVENLIFL